MSEQLQKVYIGLGSNLNQPKKQLALAVTALRALPDTHYLKDSGVFLSKPLLTDEQQSNAADMPDYYNAVALLETSLQPLVLLDELQKIEERQGRERFERWAARSLDLDILLYGELQIKSERLQIPHPGLCEREFVLYPLLAIAPDIEIPGHGKLTRYIEKCSKNDLLYLGLIGEAR